MSQTSSRYESFLTQDAPSLRDILTLMGGLGYQLLGGGLNVGIPYFVQWKVTEDTLPPGIGPISPAIQAAKDWSAGLGAEADLFWSKTDGVTLRFLQGFSGANTTNGQSYFLYYNHILAFGGAPANQTGGSPVMLGAQLQP